MAAKLPWFRFEATTWLSDPKVRMMTSQQRGWYIDLLCWAWQEGGIDLETIGYLVKSRHDIDFADDNTEFNRDFEAVLSHFTHECENGLFTHPKLAENRAGVAQKSEKATESANKRWHSDRNAKAKQTDSVGNANALLRASYSSSKSLSESKEGGAGETMTPAFDEQYAEFRTLFEAVGNPIPEEFANGSFCWRAWSILDFFQRKTVIASLEERKAAGVTVMHKPDTYLTKREYLRKIKQHTNGGRLTRDQEIDRAIAEA